MGSRPAGSGALPARLPLGRPLRAVFLGPAIWLENCCPPEVSAALHCQRFPMLAEADEHALLAAVEESRPDVCVVFDPASLGRALLASLPGVTLGILPGGLDEELAAGGLPELDRVASFRPSLTGEAIGAQELWRAFPPPVADELFAAVRPMHGPPRAMSVGRSTPHREKLLMPAKHHHDLLQVLHGLGGERLAELLGEHEVGVYVPPGPGESFGQQVSLHLAAGQLLLSQPLSPAHGLERGIDYVQFHAAEELVWILDRLARFPEMHERVRVRGRMKAEQYRASRLFGRVLQDLLAEIVAFAQ